MNYKKIILVSLFSWSHLFGNSPSLFSSLDSMLKNKSVTINDAAKAFLVFSATWCVASIVHNSFYKRPDKEVISRGPWNGVKGMLADGGFTMVAKTSLVAFPLWCWKYGYEK